MAKSVDKKFGWLIKDFSSLQSEKCYSAPVSISDCKWRLLAYPKGNIGDYLSLYLDVANPESLPCGWSRYVKLGLTLVNQLSPKLSVLKETEHCFDGKSTTWGIPAMLPLSKLHEKDSGFLVKGQVMIVAELDVFEVFGTLDDGVAESNGLLKKTSTGNDVNGTKQVENSVKPSSKIKRWWRALWFFIFFLILGKLAETIGTEMIESSKRNV